MAELSEADQKVLDDIKEHGVHIVHVLGEEDLPPFSYSVGLYETYDHPEVIIIGLRRELTHVIINNIAEDVKSGYNYPVRGWSDDILDDYKCLFIPVDKTNYRDYVGYDMWYYDGDDFPLLQCLYPTSKGVFPWEDAWPAEMKPLQPILGAFKRSRPIMNEFTLGVEEEFMVIDPVTRELKSHEQKIVDAAQKIHEDQVKAEMHQAVVEVGTHICRNTEEARKEVSKLRLTVAQLAGDIGLRIGAAGTHPFSSWQHQLITDHPRYFEIVDEMQDAARSNLIFGLHVHVGIQSRDMAIHIANQVRYFLPHVYALSTNSPFWEGRNTGFKSYRTKVFDKFPRTGIPDFFSSIEEYDNYVKLLVKTNCIDNAKKIWWDIRVHPFFETIEFRICDCPMLVDETMAFTALFQCLCAKLYKLRQQNMKFITYTRALINENKWRAARYGIDGKMIDFGKEMEVNTRSLVLELLDFIDDVVDELGCREDLQYIHKILEHGTGADRQLEVYQQNHNFTDVVDYITAQTLKGV